MNAELSTLIKRGMNGRSINEFAREAGISAGNLSRILRGQIPSAAMLKKIAEACEGTTLKQLLFAAGYSEEAPEKSPGIPIYGTVAAGLPINAYEEILGYIDIDYDLAGTVEDYFALKVRGNSMDLACIPDKSVIIAKKAQTINQGDIGVFVINGEATVKQFQRAGEHILLLPVSSDASHKPQVYGSGDSVTLLGQVVKSVVNI